MAAFHLPEGYVISYGDREERVLFWNSTVLCSSITFERNIWCPLFVLGMIKSSRCHLRKKQGPPPNLTFRLSQSLEAMKILKVKGIEGNNNEEKF